MPLGQRLIEFPNESFKISGNKLFCHACKEELPNLKEGIKRHAACSKHKTKLNKHLKAIASNADLTIDLAEYFKNHRDEKGVSCELCVYM